MKYVYALWSSESESLPVLYSSKRKALKALKEEFACLEGYAKRCGNYRVRYNDDNTAFTITTENGEELSANVERTVIH